YVYVSHNWPPLLPDVSGLILAWLKEESNNLDGLLDPFRVLFFPLPHLARDHFDRHAKLELGRIGLNVYEIAPDADPIRKVYDGRDVRNWHPGHRLVDDRVDI